VADRFALRARVWPSLREIGCGGVDGWTLARVRRRFPRLWAANLARADERFRWPGGESYREFRARCLRAIRRIAAAHLGARVVVVTHAGVITQVLAAIHGIAPARWDAFRVGNASVTVVRWDRRGAAAGAAEATRLAGAALVRFDDRSHLEGVPWRARGTRRRRPARATGVATKAAARAKAATTRTGGGVTATQRRQTASARRRTRRWSYAARADSARLRDGAAPHPSATTRW
jgi:broad specificity phosphatase PhoE